MRIPAKALCAAVILSLTACRSSAQPAHAPAPAPTDVVATVGSAQITLADVDERALQQPVTNFGGVKLVQAIYDARREAIEELIGVRLIEQAAKTAGIDVAAMEQREITAKVETPTDDEVTSWFGANQARLGGAPLDQVRSPIRTFLLEERTKAARQQYIDGLRAKASIRTMLDPPRQKVEAAGRPDRGPANAPIEIIEFSDFQCPFCLRAHPTVAKVLSTYGDRVHFVYRHFPLPNHPNARPAAEAAACAAAQGKFWEYHDRLFENQSKLADGDLKRHAADMGLNAAKFNECFDAKQGQKGIDDDIAVGKALGVTGTPAFFINGRQLEGAQPFENFKSVIDEELAAKKG